MKLIIQKSNNFKEENKIIEILSTDINNNNIPYFIRANQTPIIKYTDTEQFFLINNIQENLKQYEGSEILLNIQESDLIIFNSVNNENEVPGLQEVLDVSPTGNNVTFEDGGLVLGGGSKIIPGEITPGGTTVLSPNNLLLNENTFFQPNIVQVSETTRLQQSELRILNELVLTNSNLQWQKIYGDFIVFPTSDGDLRIQSPNLNGIISTIEYVDNSIITPITIISDATVALITTTERKYYGITTSGALCSLPPIVDYEGKTLIIANKSNGTIQVFSNDGVSGDIWENGITTEEINILSGEIITFFNDSQNWVVIKNSL